jgi:hypothetical protein
MLELILLFGRKFSFYYEVGKLTCLNENIYRDNLIRNQVVRGLSFWGANYTIGIMSSYCFIIDVEFY